MHSLFSASFWLWENLPWKKLSRYLKKWWLVGKRATKANEAKLCSPIHSTFEAFVRHAFRHSLLWIRTGPFMLTSAGCRYCSFQCIILLSLLPRYNGFARIQKAVVDQMGRRPPNTDHDLFLVQVWLWEVLWSFFSVQPLSWSLPFIVCNLLFITHHNLIENWWVDVV